MKKFSLSTKRVSKALALTLVAAMVVPNVPAPKSEAADYKDVVRPTVLASENFDKLPIKATNVAVGTKIVVKDAGCASPGGITLSASGNAVMVPVDVSAKAPTLTTGKAVGSKAVKLENSITNNTTFTGGGASATPAALIDPTVGSGVKITNPYVAKRNDLYDAKAYNWDNRTTVATAKEVENKSLVTKTAIENLSKRYSRPDVKKTVSIAFWGKAPADATTSFLEFRSKSNTAQTVSKGAYIVANYKARKTAKTLNAEDSLFYGGKAVKAKVASMSSEAKADFPKYNPVSSPEVAYLDGQGAYVELSGANVATGAVVGTTTESVTIDGGSCASGASFVYVEGSRSLDFEAAAGEVVVETGETVKVKEGNKEVEKPVFIHLVKKAIPTKPEQWKTYDDNKDATIETVAEWGNKGSLSVGVNAGKPAVAFKEGKAANNNEAKVESKNKTDADWHYYTVTIADDWFQIYMDGKAVNANITGKDGFNMGSGLFDGSKSQGGKITDAQKILDVNAKLFNKTVMDFITSADLYVGGASVATAANTLIDDMTFYAEKLSADQVAYEYGIVKGDIGVGNPEPVATVDFTNDSDVLSTVGATAEAIKFTDTIATQTFIDHTSDPVVVTEDAVVIGNADMSTDGAITVNDAITVLNHVAKIAEITDEKQLKAANANKSTDGAITVDDAITILNHVAKIQEIEQPEPGTSTETPTFTSLDPVPVSRPATASDAAADIVNIDGKDVVLEKEKVNVGPEIKDAAEVEGATTAGVDGKVVVLKNSAEVKKYPSEAGEKDVLQEAATFSSGVEIANPFTAYRDELFDASRYEGLGLLETVSEYEVWSDKATNPFADATEGATNGKNNMDLFKYNMTKRVSGPAPKTGVTISFWVKTKAEAETSMIEFRNTKTLNYGADSLAQAWLYGSYADAMKEGTANTPASPFYAGEVKTLKVTDVNANCAADFKAQTGADFDKDAEQTFSFVYGQGIYAKVNPLMAQSKAAIAKNAEKGEYKVYIIKSQDTKSTSGNKEITVDSGTKDAKNNTIYYHLTWSDTVYDNLKNNSHYWANVPKEGKPYGDSAEATASGSFTAGTNEKTWGNAFGEKGGVSYNSDDGKGAILTDTPQKGVKKQVTNNMANIYSKEKEKVADGEWHYYTLTIRDSWFQVYVDGVALNYDHMKTSDKFNRGSGLYNPNNLDQHSGWVSDWKKFTSGNGGGQGHIAGYLYGQMHSRDVMDFITDENTKLYVGAASLPTVEDTMIADMSFYKKVLSKEEIAAAYEDARAN